jgi:hypothetical protein
MVFSMRAVSTLSTNSLNASKHYVLRKQLKLNFLKLILMASPSESQYSSWPASKRQPTEKLPLESVPYFQNICVSHDAVTCIRRVVRQRYKFPAHSILLKDDNTEYHYCPLLSSANLQTILFYCEPALIMMEHAILGWSIITPVDPRLVHLLADELLYAP